MMVIITVFCFYFKCFVFNDLLINKKQINDLMKKLERRLWKQKYHFNSKTNEITSKCDKFHTTYTKCK